MIVQKSVPAVRIRLAPPSQSRRIRIFRKDERNCRAFVAFTRLEGHRRIGCNRYRRPNDRISLRAGVPRCPSAPCLDLAARPPYASKRESAKRARRGPKAEFLSTLDRVGVLRATGHHTSRPMVAGGN